MDRKKVMIIDDDAATLNLMVSQVEALYDVKGFTSGEEALDALCSADKSEGGWIPNLILLDIVMSGMDGYQVLERLKGNEKLKTIPVVFLTGMTDETSECRGLEMDVVDYLKKPVASKVLFARIQRYIDLYSDPSSKGKLAEEKLAALPVPLTGRELEVARLMAEFRSDREICDILFISMPYVKKLVEAVKEKLFLDKRGDIRKYLIA
jgi:putative two-component system response regulator